MNMVELIITKLRKFLFGKPIDALNPFISKNIALISVIAWVGLGADGLSSSSYGPEVAFLALGKYTSTAVYLAILTSITIFIIAFSYNQVIELFPNGGGGYKVATHLLGPYVGLVAGSALIVDYILTISVSIASATDAMFSLFPSIASSHKILVEIILIICLIILNMRGIKESISVLLPLFIGFLLTHIVFISFGIIYQFHSLSSVLSNAHSEAIHLSSSIGIFAALAMFLKAYSLGGGTYTGLEAVSNNVNMLAEPKVRTGKLTMLYMAISLSLTASGILLLYLLWHIHPVHHKTLNAVLFSHIVSRLHLRHYWVWLILFFEATLLLVGANSGFLGCPSVLANMASDKWLPRRFSELSDRLVTQNGVLISGISAIVVVLWTHGKIFMLVVLYSINVFLTFSITLLGLSVYWYKSRKLHKRIWIRKLLLSFLGFCICFLILMIIVAEKFTKGGWTTLLITTIIVSICIMIRKHYQAVGEKLRTIDNIFSPVVLTEFSSSDLISITDKNAKTAVFFVGKHYGVSIHTLLWVNKLFPNVFVNYVFLTAGEVDSFAMSNKSIYQKNYRQDLNKIIEQYRCFCTKHNMPSDGLFSYGIYPTEELLKLSSHVHENYPNCIFFASKLTFMYENWWTNLLHNNTLDSLQQKLHLEGKQMVILPIKI